MNVRDVLGIVAASIVLVMAVSGHTTTSHRKSVHFSAPVGAHQKVNGTAGRSAAEPRLQRPYGILAEIAE
jgi:hypothetical protein